MPPYTYTRCMRAPRPAPRAVRRPDRIRSRAAGSSAGAAAGGRAKLLAGMLSWLALVPVVAMIAAGSSLATWSRATVVTAARAGAADVPRRFEQQPVPSLQLSVTNVALTHGSLWVWLPPAFVDQLPDVTSISCTAKVLELPSSSAQGPSAQCLKVQVSTRRPTP